MTATPDDVRRWQDAGVIDAAAAARILAFEAGRTAAEQPPDRPGVPELLVYLAAAVTGAGFAVLAATEWGDLSTAARILVPGLSALALLGVGFALRQRGPGAAMRAASLTWLVAGVLVTVTAAIAASEAGWADENVALAAGVVAVATGIALWAPMRMHPQVVGIAAALFLLSSAIGSRAPEDWIPAVIGSSLALFGLIAMAATEGGAFVPRASARLLAGAAIGAGAFFAGMPPAPAAMELLAAGGVIVLVGAGVRYRSLVYVGFGVLLAFTGLLTLILRHVQSPTIAGLALVVIGVLLLLAIAALRRTLPWARPHAASGDGDAAEVSDGAPTMPPRPSGSAARQP